MLSIATIDLRADESAAVWITGTHDEPVVDHLDTEVFFDGERHPELVRHLVDATFVYAPRDAAAAYVRELGFAPISVDNLRQPTATLRALMGEGPGDVDPLPTQPDLESEPRSSAALAAESSAEYLREMWQAWLDVESLRAKVLTTVDGIPVGPMIRALPDEFVIAHGW